MKQKLDMLIMIDGDCNCIEKLNVDVKSLIFTLKKKNVINMNLKDYHFTIVTMKLVKKK